MQVELCEDQGSWDEIVHELNGHPLQLWGWGEVKAAHGWKAHRLIVKDEEGRVAGAAQVLTRTLPGPFKAINYIPRGPVCKDKFRTEVTKTLADYAKVQLPGVALTMEPDSETAPDENEWRRTENTILIPHTLILDLTKTEDELQADLSKNTKYYIRKAARDGVEVRQAKTREEIAACLEMYHETAARAHFALHNDQYYYDIHDMLADSSVVFVAHKDGQPLAFLWLAVSSQTAFELYGGVTEAGQKLRVNNLLKWYAISKCKEWGVERYDMNGLLNDGISEFKKGFSHQETMLAGSFDYPTSPLYTLWITVAPRVRALVQKIKSLR